MGIANGTLRYMSASLYYRYLNHFSYEEFSTERPKLDTYDGQRFPYEDGAFDVLYSNGVFHLINNHGRIIEEMARVLSDDGYLNINFRNESSLHGYRTPNCEHPSFSDSAPRPWAHLRDWSPSELGLLGPKQHDAIFETFDSVFGECHIL